MSFSLKIIPFTFSRVSYRSNTSICDKSRLVFIVACLTFFAPQKGFSQIIREDSLAIEILTKNMYPISFHENSVSGEGFDFLMKLANNSQFVAVGEQHGLKEPSLLTKSILRKSQNVKRFHAIALESGPLLTGTLVDSYQTFGYDSVRGLMKDYAGSMAFLSYVEDFAIVREFMEQNPEVKISERIWGIDQEFIYSLRWILIEVKKYPINAKLRQEIDNLERRAWRYFDQIDSANNGLTLINMAAADVDRLMILSKGESEEVRSRIQAIYDSWKIYNGKSQSHELRIKYIKKNFVENYKKLSEQYDNPRVLVKIGGSHAGKGYSNLNVLDIGNFLAEKAVESDMPTLHIVLTMLSGVTHRYSTYEDENDEFDYLPVLPPRLKFYFSSLSEKIEGNAVVVDLSQLRHRIDLVTKLPEEIRQIVLGYDLLVLVNGARPASLIRSN